MKRRTILVISVAFVLSLAALTAFGWRPLQQVSARAGVLALDAPAAPGGVASGAAAAARVRRMWAGSDTNNYVKRSPSPNGRYVVEADPYGDLGVRDLATGERHSLDPGNESYVANAIFSPAGDRIAYSRYDRASAAFELWMMDFVVDAAGKPRGLHHRRLAPASTDLATYDLYGWSDDDEILTGTWRVDGTFALVLFSVPTGTLKILKSFDWRDPDAVMTPDTRLIAYDFPVGDGDGDRDIYLLSDETRVTPLVKSPGDDRVLGWLPDRSGLLYLRDEDGRRSVWRLPMADGVASGPPVLVRDGLWNLEPLGFARDTFFFSVRTDHPRFVTANLDVETGSLLPQPTVFADAYGGRIRTLEWSPDGQYVVHDVVRRPNAQGLIIVERSADGQVVHEWEFDLSMTRVALRWTPDGRAVVLNAFDARGHEALRRIDLESGRVETIREFAKGDPGTGNELNFGNPGGFALSPDGRRLDFVYADFRERHDLSTVSVVSHDLASDAERTLYRLGDGGMLEYSPDGKWLAALTDRRFPNAPAQELRLIDAASGKARVLATGKANVRLFRGFAGWSPNSEWVYFDVMPEGGLANDSAELWRASVSGQGVQKVAHGVPQARLGPDGRTLAYRAGSTKVEVWAMDQLTGGGSR